MDEVGQGESVVGGVEADLESFGFAGPAFALGLGDGGLEVVADLFEAVPLGGWCLETQAWQVLTAGDYRRAAGISHAQHVAPRDGSAFIQATAQEGRAWARLGAAAESRAALARVEHLVSPLAMPDRPEHHYRYDPARSQAYTATTQSWLGDWAAESSARMTPSWPYGP